MEKMIVSALIGGIIVQLINLAIWWITKPRLSFKIGCEAPFLIDAPREDSPTGSARWIRVRVNNRGWRDATSCRVYLTDVFRQGAKEPILKEDVLSLWASAGGDGDPNPYAPLTIPRDFGRFFDVAFIAGRDELTVASREFWIRTRAMLPPGIYEFGIAASGSNFDPITGRVKIKFDGASAPVSVSLI